MIFMCASRAKIREDLQLGFLFYQLPPLSCTESSLLTSIAPLFSPVFFFYSFQFFIRCFFPLFLTTNFESPSISQDFLRSQQDIWGKHQAIFAPSRVVLAKAFLQTSTIWSNNVGPASLQAVLSAPALNHPLRSYSSLGHPRRIQLWMHEKRQQSHCEKPDASSAVGWTVDGELAQTSSVPTLFWCLLTAATLLVEI